MTLDSSSFDAFKASAEAAGCDEVLVREWPAGTVLDEHRHDFDAQAVVVRGEMWLTLGGATRHLRPGDTFAVPLGTPHAERYGPEGAAYWVARRSAKAR